MFAENNRNVDSHSFEFLTADEQHNAAFQLRRAISIPAKRIRLLEKHAIAPSAASLLFRRRDRVQAFVAFVTYGVL